MISEFVHSTFHPTAAASSPPTSRLHRPAAKTLALAAAKFAAYSPLTNNMDAHFRTMTALSAVSNAEDPVNQHGGASIWHNPHAHLSSVDALYSPMLPTATLANTSVYREAPFTPDSPISPFRLPPADLMGAQSPFAAPQHHLEQSSLLFPIASSPQHMDLPTVCDSPLAGADFVECIDPAAIFLNGPPLLPGAGGRHPETTMLDGSTTTATTTRTTSDGSFYGTTTGSEAPDSVLTSFRRFSVSDLLKEPHAAATAGGDFGFDPQMQDASMAITVPEGLLGMIDDSDESDMDMCAPEPAVSAYMSPVMGGPTVAVAATAIPELFRQEYSSTDDSASPSPMSLPVSSDGSSVFDFEQQSLGVDPLALPDAHTMVSALALGLAAEAQVAGVNFADRQMPLGTKAEQKAAASASRRPVKVKVGKVRRRRISVTKRGGKGFSCTHPGCPKSFKRSEHMKRHVQSVHSKDKPFACTFPNCTKSFSRSDNLSQHFQTHRSNKPKEKKTSEKQRSNSPLSAVTSLQIPTSSYLI